MTCWSIDLASVSGTPLQHQGFIIDRWNAMATVVKLTGGLDGLAKARKVEVVRGLGQFAGPNTVRITGDSGSTLVSFDQCIAAAGSEPLTLPFIPHDDARVNVDEHGVIAVDNQQRTNVPPVFAIGDVVARPMLTHKAVHEGKVTAEVCAGHKRTFGARVIPSMAYTEPDVAWAGLTENQAKAQGIKTGKGVFPWAASGRLLSIGRSEGMTKLLFDETDHRVLGAGIVGPHTGDLIAEAALATEMGSDATDPGHAIHPQPTLSETVNFAAEMYEGTITDLMPPKKR